mmetsp:Transcript_59890/g.106517  ORF Transcript_59890/g.106517 Transcript_59890/m.106517 type:complete len:130 (+) Transcript_59890:135-524(+)
MKQERTCLPNLRPSKSQIFLGVLKVHDCCSVQSLEGRTCRLHAVLIGSNHAVASQRMAPVGLLPILMGSRLDLFEAAACSSIRSAATRASLSLSKGEFCKSSASPLHLSSSAIPPLLRRLGREEAWNCL